jgi:predicted acylesterase/phospholipase RssA
MIELFNDLYRFILSGVSIGFLVAALFLWYCVHRDMKEKEAFDDKYKKSRNIKDNKWE